MFCPIESMNFRWGISLRGSDYGLIQDNVLFNWSGAGLMTEDGSESFNVIAHNFASDITGTGSRGDDRMTQNDFGFEGAGFWLRGGNNYVRDNVAAQCLMYGYNIFATNAGVVSAPAYQGADPSAGGNQAVSLDVQDTPLLQFQNDQAYGAMTTGLTIWNIGVDGATTPLAIGQSVVKDFLVWNQSRYGYYGYPTNNFLLQHFVARGDTSTLSNPNTGSVGMWFSDYLTQNNVIDNADIQGEQAGIMAPVKVSDTRATGKAVQTFTVQNSYLRNYVNVVVMTMSAVTGGGDGLTPRQVVLRNDLFARPLDQDRAPDDPQLDIQMDYQTDQANTDLM